MNGKRVDLAPDIGGLTRLLKSVEFFAVFDDRELMTVYAKGRVVKFNSGDFIVREEDADLSFFVILQGKVKVIKKTAAGIRRLKIAELGTGGCFGEIAMLTGVKRTADVVADGAGYVFVIGADGIEELETPLRKRFYKRICLFMAYKIKRLSETVVDLI